MRRSEIEATLNGGGYAVLVDGPEAAMEVVNPIAPEHLEMMGEGAERMVAGVRHAGAVFIGPWRRRRSVTTSPGPATCCPRSAPPASRRPSRSPTSPAHPRRHPRPRALARVGPAVAALAEAEGLPAHALSVRCGRAQLWPSPRPIGPGRHRRLEGYHSAQVDVDVRLNTNESP